MRRLFIAIFASVAVLSLSCKKSGEENKSYEVITVGCEVDYEEVKMNGRLGPDARIEEVTEVGFLLSTKENVTWDTQNCKNVSTSSIDKDFTLSYLTPELDVFYYYRAYCVMGGEMYLGTVKSFRTKGAAPTGVTILDDDLNMETGSSVTLRWFVTPKEFTSQEVEWSTSNDKVATVSGGKVTGVGAGTCVVTATVPGTSIKGQINVRVRSKQPAGSVYLGFGPYWAESNLGTSKPYGDFFSWGYRFSSTSFWKASYDYNKDFEDAASYIKGGKWRTPTSQEFSELISKCNLKVETVDGHKGVRFTSKVNGNSIFLPAAGGKFEKDGQLGHWGEGLLLYYWTKTKANGQDGYCLVSDTADITKYPPYVSSAERYCGFPIRPVSD